MAGQLEGKVAVVTGGASGLGRAISTRIAEAGARAVVVADIEDKPREDGEPTTVLVARAGAVSAFIHTDVTNAADVAAAIDAAATFGGVDVMVNNAGVGSLEDFYEMTAEQFDLIMGVNAKGVFLGAQAAARSMRGRGGSIVNVSSIGGIRGAAALPVYCASKAAVRLLSCALGQRLAADGIRVNAVHPGPLDTAMNRLDVGIQPGVHLADPLGVADAVVFLGSDAAASISGTSLVVDGGALAI
jgi:NAD(P)-dependent dehydrogenase (short-subunit alcohol dehydrogenase family)